MPRFVWIQSSRPMPHIEALQIGPWMIGGIGCGGRSPIPSTAPSCRNRSIYDTRDVGSMCPPAQFWWPRLQVLKHSGSGGHLPQQVVKLVVQRRVCLSPQLGRGTAVMEVIQSLQELQALLFLNPSLHDDLSMPHRGTIGEHYMIRIPGRKKKAADEDRSLHAA